MYCIVKRSRLTAQAALIALNLCTALCTVQDAARAVDEAVVGGGKGA